MSRVSHLGDRRRQQVIGINQRNREFIYRFNERRDYPIADDKLIAKSWLLEYGIPVVATLTVCHGLFAVPSAVEALQDEAEFVVKPARGAGGDGILVVGERLGRGLWRTAGGELLSAADLKKHLAQIVFGAFSKGLDDRVLVERRVRPPAFFAELSPSGLSDIRVITLKGKAVVAMLRLPTIESGGRANLSQNGVGVAVDLATGRLTRAVQGGRPIELHPDSKRALCGQVLPEWREVVRLAERVAEVVPLGYLGSDLILDGARGPCVLEINARPGIEIQNVQGRGLLSFLGVPSE